MKNVTKAKKRVVVRKRIRKVGLKATFPTAQAAQLDRTPKALDVIYAEENPPRLRPGAPKVRTANQHPFADIAGL